MSAQRWRGRLEQVRFENPRVQPNAHSRSDSIFLAGCVVDIGSGKGYLTTAIAAEYGLTTVGIDRYYYVWPPGASFFSWLTHLLIFFPCGRLTIRSSVGKILKCLPQPGGKHERRGQEARARQPNNDWGQRFWK